MSDGFGTYDTPCPDCGGSVEWWYFGADCRGNPPSSGINCKDCGHKFTPAEWAQVADKEPSND